MNRIQFLQRMGWVGAGAMLLPDVLHAMPSAFPLVRKPIGERNFTSSAIEKAIADFKTHVKDEELGWLFENCFPNTLDTTVFIKSRGKDPDTYVITGDIDALFELRAHYDKLMRYKLNKEIKIMAEKFDLDPAWFGFDDLLGDMGVIFDNAVMSFRD